MSYGGRAAGPRRSLLDSDLRFFLRCICCCSTRLKRVPAHPDRRRLILVALAGIGHRDRALRWSSSTYSSCGSPEAHACLTDGLHVRERGDRLSRRRPRLALAFGATLLGVVAGCMPGLSATPVITLLTTLTLKMQPGTAILVLVCAYNGAIYGGSCTRHSAQHSRHRRQRRRLSRWLCNSRAKVRPAARWASPLPARWSATLFGLICLALFTPMLGEIAPSFGAFEFFGWRCLAL